jgi:DNA-directed RNA polymerase specialized sigma24 family protein
MTATHDQEYAAVVERERPLIQATAYLLTGDPVRAERLAQLVFAQLYGRLPRVQHPPLEAFQTLVRAARGPIKVPWEHRMRFELMDGPPRVPAVAPIVSDLGRLSYEQRVAIILVRYAGLSSGQIAEILQRPVDDLLLLAQRAQVALAAGHPERTSDDALARELKDAIPHDLLEPNRNTDDLAHGRQLLHRRWLRRGSAALVAVLLLVVAAGVLLPTRRAVQPVGSVPQVGSSAPTSTPSKDCDPVTTPVCRSKILFEWRSDMAEVASSYLDPRGEYFSGFGYYYDTRYDMPSFWSGQGGALAFEMFRLEKGATEVYLQVATSRKFAVRCGATTGQECIFIRFMDGNSYLMTDSTLKGRGIEVQHNPRGDLVVTVIARNTQRGQMLEISRGDLIKLVQDKRLRLPKR